MDQVAQQRIIEISPGPFTTTSRYKDLTSNFNQLHRTLPSPNKFSWIMSCLTNIQLFLWKALIEGLWTFDTDILPRCIYDPKTAIQIHYHIVVDSWLKYSENKEEIKISNFSPEILYGTHTSILYIIKKV